MIANVGQLFSVSRMLPEQDRLLLARLLLDSVLEEAQPVSADATDWQALSLSQFQEGLDNEEDAIYDNWREHYRVPAR